MGLARVRPRVEMLYEGNVCSWRLEGGGHGLLVKGVPRL